MNKSVVASVSAVALAVSTLVGVQYHNNYGTDMTNYREVDTVMHEVFKATGQKGDYPQVDYTVSKNYVGSVCASVQGCMSFKDGKIVITRYRTVTVSDTLYKMHTKEELEFVLAHEMGHLYSYDKYVNGWQDNGRYKLQPYYGKEWWYFTTPSIYIKTRLTKEQDQEVYADLYAANLMTKKGHPCAYRNWVEKVISVFYSNEMLHKLNNGQLSIYDNDNDRWVSPNNTWVEKDAHPSLYYRWVMSKTFCPNKKAI